MIEEEELDEGEALGHSLAAAAAVLLLLFLPWPLLLLRCYSLFILYPIVEPHSPAATFRRRFFFLAII